MYNYFHHIKCNISIWWSCSFIVRRNWRYYRNCLVINPMILTTDDYVWNFRIEPLMGFDIIWLLSSSNNVKNLKRHGYRNQHIWPLGHFSCVVREKIWNCKRSSFILFCWSWSSQFRARAQKRQRFNDDGDLQTTFFKPDIIWRPSTFLRQYSNNVLVYLTVFSRSSGRNQLVIESVQQLTNVQPNFRIVAFEHQDESRYNGKLAKKHYQLAKVKS